MVDPVNMTGRNNIQLNKDVPYSCLTLHWVQLLGSFLSSGKMGQKRGLTDSEKSKNIKHLSEGCSTLEIAKILGHDHRTIKPCKYPKGSQDTCWEKKTQINCQRFDQNQMWSYQEPIILQCCHTPELQPTWSVQEYKVFSAQVRKAQTQPPLNKTHKLKQQDWAKK